MYILIRSFIYSTFVLSNHTPALQLSTVNAGGENVARTSALGALFGAAFGNQDFTKKRKQWQADLYYHDQVALEIQQFVQSALLLKSELWDAK